MSSAVASSFASISGITGGVCVINGKSFRGSSLVINSTGTYVDGVKVDDDLVKGKQVNVTINGAVDGNIEASGRVEVNGNVTGRVRAGMELKCGNVDGNASAGMSCDCGDVGGDVRAGMGVEANGHIHGSVSARMGVKCCKKK